MSIVRKRKTNIPLRIGPQGDIFEKDIVIATAANASLIVRKIMDFVKKVRQSGFFTAEFSHVDPSNKSPIFTSIANDGGTTIGINSMPKGMGKLIEKYVFPRSNVLKGGKEFDLFDLIRDYANMIDDVDHVIEKLDKDSALYYYEKNSQKGHTLVANGILFPTAFAGRNRLGDNFVPGGIRSDVAAAYRQILGSKVDYIKLMTSQRNEIESLSLARFRNTGTLPAAKGIDMERNILATILSITTGIRLITGKMTIEEISRIWAMNGPSEIEWRTGQYGERRQRSGNYSSIYVLGGNGTRSVGFARGVTPKNRIISMTNGILKAANKISAKAVSMALYSTDFHPRLPAEMWKRYNDNLKNDMIPFSTDYSRYDTTIGPGYQQNYLDSIMGGAGLMSELLEYEMRAPWLGPGKTEFEEGRIYKNDLEALASGNTHTSLIGSTNNVQLIAEAIATVYNKKPFEGYRSHHDFWVFSDDNVVFLPKRDNRIDKIIDHISAKGYVMKTEPGAIFLMKIMTPSGPTNMISRFLQSFFQSERPKNDPGIESLSIVVNLQLLENHPGKPALEKIIDDYVRKNSGVTLHKNIKEMQNWYLSDDMKKYLYEYARRSRQSADTIADIFNSVTSGMISGGEDTELIEKMFGIQYEVPAIEVSTSYLRTLDLAKNRNMLAAFARESKTSVDIGLVARYIMELGISKKQYEYN